MNNTILAIFNDLGTFAFALSGARLIDGKTKHSLTLAFLPAFLTAFGGGLTRDIVVLRRTPAIVHSQDAVAIMLMTFVFYVVIKRLDYDHIFSDSKVDIALVVCDAIGVAAFIQCGSDAAFKNGANLAICTLTGVMTAIGGGILASVAAGKHVFTILRSAFSYRLIVIIHATYYVFYRNALGQEPPILGLAASCVLFCVLREFIIKSSIQFERTRDSQTPLGKSQNIFVISRGKLFNMVKKILTYKRSKWISFNYRGRHVYPLRLLLR